MAQPVSFRWDEEFVKRIDAARGLIPRSAFVRAAVERVLALSEIPIRVAGSRPEDFEPGGVCYVEGEDLAPAEQPESAIRASNEHTTIRVGDDAENLSSGTLVVGPEVTDLLRARRATQR